MSQKKWIEDLRGTKRKRERRLRLQRKKEREKKEVLKKYSKRHIKELIGE